MTKHVFGCFSEMIEAVGHEFYEAFFGCCEVALAKDGIFVMQVTFASPSRLSHGCTTLDRFNV